MLYDILLWLGYLQTKTMEYGYLIGALTSAFFWSIIFFTRKDLRKQMTITGLLFLPFFLIDKMLIPNYWQPRVLFDLYNKAGFSLESIIFMFTASGLFATLYEFVTKSKEKAAIIVKPSKRTLLFLIYIYSTFIILTSFDLGIHLLSSLMPFVAIIIFITIQRHDLLKPIIASSILGLGLYFASLLVFSYFLPNFFTETYNLENLWGISILGIHLEEILWGIYYPALMACAYEYLFGVKLVQQKSI